MVNRRGQGVPQGGYLSKVARMSVAKFVARAFVYGEILEAVVPPPRKDGGYRSREVLAPL